MYAFMAWLPTWKQGRIAEKINLRTVVTAATVFMRMIRDQTGFRYGDRFRRELLQVRIREVAMRTLQLTPLSGVAKASSRGREYR